MTQKYKYDCGVATVYNLLKSANIDLDYFDLLKQLKTTTLYGTFPKDIETFLLKYSYVDFEYSVSLICSKKFDNNDEDYGHYVNVIGFDNNKYKIFDPFDGLYHDISEKKLKFMTKDVLVGKKTRFNNINFGNLDLI